MFYFLLAGLLVVLFVVVVLSFRKIKDPVDIDNTFNDLYTESLVKELETKEKMDDLANRASYYTEKYFSSLPEAVDVPDVPVVIEPVKVVKKKATKKKTAKKKTAKKRTAKKVLKDENV